MIICLTGLFFSCKDEDEPFGAVLETDLEQLNFGENEASKFISINTNRTFTVSSTAGWCKTELVESMLENLKISVEQNVEIGRSRTTEVSIDSEGIDSKKITVVQEGAPVVLSVAERSIVKETGDEFSLEITANVLFVFELPEWIHEKSGNTAPAIGMQTYYFILDELLDGEYVRSGSINVKAANPEFDRAVAIPVRQGKDPVVDEGINKTTPYIIEAETSLEGLTERQQAWWAESGTMFGSDYYISPNTESVSYAVHVADAANYDFSFILACWSSGVSMTLYVDDVEARTVSSIPVTDGTAATTVVVEGIALPAGDHVIKISFTGYADFNKFTVTYNPVHIVQNGVVCTIEAESCLEGLEAQQQAWWAESGTMFGSNYYIVPNSSVTYPIKVNDAGNYNFVFAIANWGSTTFVLYIDDNAVSGTISPPTSDGEHTTYSSVANVALTTGNHTVKVTFSDWMSFDKFVISQ